MQALALSNLDCQVNHQTGRPISIFYFWRSGSLIFLVCHGDAFPKLYFSAFISDFSVYFPICRTRLNH